MFRIALGSGSCEGIESKLSKSILERLVLVERYSFDNVVQKYSEVGVNEFLENSMKIYEIFEKIDDENYIVVIQGTKFSFIPNYITFNFWGELRAEGIIFNKQGNKVRAEDKIMNQFR